MRFAIHEGVSLVRESMTTTRLRAGLHHMAECTWQLSNFLYFTVRYSKVAVGLGVNQTRVSFPTTSAEVDAPTTRNRQVWKNLLINLAKHLLAIYWTEDASLTRGRFPGQARDQIRLCRPCGVLMLKRWYVWSESSQSYESRMWKADFLKVQQQTMRL